MASSPFTKTSVVLAVCILGVASTSCKKRNTTSQTASTTIDGYGDDGSTIHFTWIPAAKEFASFNRPIQVYYCQRTKTCQKPEKPTTLDYDKYVATLEEAVMRRMAAIQWDDPSDTPKTVATRKAALLWQMIYSQNDTSNNYIDFVSIFSPFGEDVFASLGLAIPKDYLPGGSNKIIPTKLLMVSATSFKQSLNNKACQTYFTVENGQNLDHTSPDGAIVSASSSCKDGNSSNFLDCHVSWHEKDPKALVVRVNKFRNDEAHLQSFTKQISSGPQYMPKFSTAFQNAIDTYCKTDAGSNYQ